MEVLLICLVALLASGLTFVSGFGLGSILLPVFAIFFPIEAAIAATGVVHFLNNLFKLSLTYRHMQLAIVWRFGLPAIVAALAGAWLLAQIPAQVLLQYTVSSKVFTVTLLNVIIGVLMLVFALFEFLPALRNLSVSPVFIPLGGVLSGFFGGLSGHQGALRTVFLLRLGLPKQAFIATGIGIACLIDITRLTVYASQLQKGPVLPWGLIGAATLSAFAGALAGNAFLKKITLQSFQAIVAVFIILFSLALIAGLV
ncbi:MAG TPA: sulfite exporter TauE/SafE family protein [Phnomibacter sp.]|nr:sulfite exporter TauE/SafE family protein [Phnomibacter sp.]